jgi:acyl-CoA reductase-like NAD-dependent aldehyde dehydrogenase
MRKTGENTLQTDAVETVIADVVNKGAKLVTGGKRVLTDVTTNMVFTKEEAFGPVAPLYGFKTDDEAIRIANDAPTLPAIGRRGSVFRPRSGHRAASGGSR